MELKKYIQEEPIAKSKWIEVKEIMATHLMGKAPESLFKTRRPLESTNEFALDYRIENFQPITMQSFSTAVSGIIETAGHVYFSVENMDSNTQEFVDNRVQKVGGKSYNLYDYYIKYVGKMVELDPNAVIVYYPIHPNEELIARYDAELPNFDNIQNQFIDIGIKVVSSRKINKLDSDEIVFYQGEWLYKVKDKKEYYKPYYYKLTKEKTSLIIPVVKGNSWDYTEVDYYLNDLEKVPFDNIGNNQVLAEIDDEYIEYYMSTFSGAVAIGNKMLGIDSDSGIVDTRFTYPEKYQGMDRCPNSACIRCTDDTKFKDLFVNYDSNGDCSTCSTCGGTGLVAPDTSPLGTHFVAKTDIINDNGTFQPLTAFVTPPLESPQYLAERVETLFHKMEDALFITRQNMTNQSGESKSYDVRQKVTVITGAVKNIFSIIENGLNTIQGYLRGSQDIEIKLPPNFNIKTSQDITLELKDSKNTSSLYKSELTKELILQKWGNTEETRKLVNFLQLNDKFFGMDVDDIIKLKAIYGNSITPKDQIIHDKGLNVLKDISTKNDVLSLSDERLLELFNNEIDRLSPIIKPISPIA